MVNEVNVWQKCMPILVILLAFLMMDGGIVVDNADARSKSGGKSFSSGPSRTAPSSMPGAPAGSGGSFRRGLAGGLLGGALGGMLFGSMFGGGGQGMGILPLLILAGVGYVLYRKFKAQQPPHNVGNPYRPAPGPISNPVPGIFGGAASPPPPPPPSQFGPQGVDQGLAEIARRDRNFDAAHFREVASDVFFQVQAGWMRRDLDSYKHLLGSQLQAEYSEHFAEMRAKGVINKLESIAIRNVSIVDAGTNGSEEFITILFTANLLDYTVSDSSGELVDGSMTQPVKFAEEWTWARPTGTENWLLEAIKVVE